MTKIKTRYDTSGGWTTENPVLLAGERGEESNTGKYKVGDGVSAWSALPYRPDFSNAALTGVPTAPTATDGTNTTQVATTQFVQAAVTAKANTASPAFTGTPTAPTPDLADDDTSIATTAFVQDVVAAAVAAAVAGAVDDAVEEAMLAAHPVGSIHMSVNSANPNTYLGGTWSSWGSGRVPVGVDAGIAAFNTVEETGGSLDHVHDLDSATSAALVRITDTDNEVRVRVKDVAAWTPTRKVEGTSNAASGAATTKAAELQGDTDTGSSLQPYITCYMWKRTA